MPRSLLLALFALLALACQSEPLEVAHVELSSLQGKWFEVAILSRERSLPQGTLSAIVQRAQEKRFPVAALRYTDQ